MSFHSQPNSESLKPHNIYKGEMEHDLASTRLLAMGSNCILPVTVNKLQEEGDFFFRCPNMCA